MSRPPAAPSGPAGAPDPSLAGLAAFAAGLKFAEIPAVVLDQAALCLLDTVACIVAGADTADGRAVLAAELELDARGDAPVLTSTARLPRDAAARVHGYWGDIFELNDLIGGHASIGVVPAVLAEALGRRRSGSEVLLATIAGIEVAARLYDAVYPTLRPYTEVGMVTPGLVNAFGAAAAVGLLRGLDAGGLEQAMAIAGTLTTWCPAEVIFGSGGSIKPMLFGATPAACGLRAVTYVQRAITGPEQLLGSGLGLFSTLSRAGEWQIDADRDRWHLARPRRKLHACCGYIHAPIDAVVALRHEFGPDLFAGSRIEVRMAPYVVPAVSKQRPPATANEARFHTEYCLALAMAGADVILPRHSAALDEHLPAVMDLLDAVTVRADPAFTHYHQCEVVVQRPSAETARRAVDGPRGTPQNPLSDAEIRAKAARLLHGRVADGAVQHYVRRFGALAAEPDVDWIAERLIRS